MFIKSMGRKTGGFAQLYDYINELRISLKQVKDLVKEGLPKAIAGELWRTCSSDTTAVAFRNSRRFHEPEGWNRLPHDLRNQVMQLHHGAKRELGRAMTFNFITLRDKEHVVVPKFLDNHHALAPRKNGNSLYHEVISFHGLDAGKLTHRILADLTKKYLELRAPNCLAYAKAHFHGHNPHVHLMISANPKGKRERHYLSKRDFSDIKRRLQEYQQKQYPELRHSLIPFEREKVLEHHLEPSPDCKPESRKEAELHRRARREKGIDLVKDRVTRTLSEALVDSLTDDAFRARILDQNLHLYERGKHIGVADLATGRKFRLQTLGLDQRYQTVLVQWRFLKEFNEERERRQNLEQELALELERQSAKLDRGHDPPGEGRADHETERQKDIIRRLEHDLAKLRQGQSRDLLEHDLGL